MSVYRDYYKAKHEQQKRQFDAPGRIKKYCWEINATIEFVEGHCQQEGCTHRFKSGCHEVIRSG